MLEARRKDGEAYPPNTLYFICSGIQRHVRELCPEIHFFKDSEFDGFRKTLDAEMKRLRSLGYRVKKKQAEPFSIEEEDELWKKDLLGNSSPQVCVLHLEVGRNTETFSFLKLSLLSLKIVTALHI